MTQTSDDEPLTRLLMVEDDERLAQLTARYLEQYGIVVTRVADGKEAIRVATCLLYTSDAADE